MSLAGEQTLDVLPPLSGMLPEGGLRRGTTLWITGQGSISLILALLAGPTATGSWSGVVGLGDLGLVAAAEMGVDVDRLALISRPGSEWPTVVAALVDAFDIVVLQPPGRVRGTDARRLTARVRERGAVLLLAGGTESGLARARIWPEAPALHLQVNTVGWRGLSRGSGHLVGRQVEVTAEGRGGASRPRRVRLWLPGPGGGVEADLSGSAAPASHLGKAVPASSPGKAASASSPGTAALSPFAGRPQGERSPEGAVPAGAVPAGAVPAAPVPVAAAG